MARLWPAGWVPSDPPVCADASASPLILTVALPDALQRQADAVRGSNRPQAAARAPAHLTLFRHLPGLGMAELGRLLRAELPAQAPELRVRPPARWGNRWVAPVASPALDALRADLAERLHGLLAPGDRAPPRLHISLSEGRTPPPPLPEGPWRARGLLLWRHRAAGAAPDAQHGGPFWTPLVALAFRG